MNRLTLATAVAGLLLCGVIVAELATDVSATVPDLVVPRVAASSAPQTSIPSPPSVDDFVRQIEARPLFTRDRKPAHVDSPLVEATGAFTRKLTGVVIDSARRAAIFGADGGKRGVIVAEGATIEGWLVAAVTPKSVTLRSATQYQVLELPRGKTASVPTVPTSTATSFVSRLVDDDPDAPPPVMPARALPLTAHP